MGSWEMVLLATIAFFLFRIMRLLEKIHELIFDKAYEQNQTAMAAGRSLSALSRMRAGLGPED